MPTLLNSGSRDRHFALLATSGIAAGRIDGNGCGVADFTTVRIDRIDTHDGTIIITDHIFNLHSVNYLRPFFPRILEQHQIEILALYLPAHRRWMIAVLEEIERLGYLFRSFRRTARCAFA